MYKRQILTDVTFNDSPTPLLLRFRLIYSFVAAFNRAMMAVSSAYVPILVACVVLFTLLFLTTYSRDWLKRRGGSQSPHFRP